MQTYRCNCGNRLFFENTQCVVCQAEVGWCECCHHITTLEPLTLDANGAPATGDNAVTEAPTNINPSGGHDYRCGNPECGATLRKCYNYAIENVCNRLFDPNRVPINNAATLAPTPTPVAADSQQPMPQQPVPPPAPMAPAPPLEGQLTVDGTGPMQAAAPVPPPAPAPVLPPPPLVPAPAVTLDCLCGACQRNDQIPDLTFPGNREKWARLEAAKRRLVYTLDLLGLPYSDPALPLSFDFKADLETPDNDWRNGGPAEVVYTGHADGKITINIREADDAEREKLRVMYGEGHRTLIGHFHHEIGHYYWQLLVEGNAARLRQFVNLFGDHNNPAYPDAMAAYYQNGPREGWPGSFISAYASAHPWEDFAETFALYLDIIAVLDTACHLFKSIKANIRGKSVAPLVERFQEIGILENEFNRTMGLIDLVPEIVAAPVVAKLQFVHDMVRSAAKKSSKSAPAPPEPVSGGDAPSNQVEQPAGEPAADAPAPIPMLMQQGSHQYYEPPAFEPVILV